MEILTVHNTGIIEACPTTSLEGFYFPNDNQQNTLIDRDGRLNRSLRDNSIVQWGDASATLAAATVFRMIFNRVISVSPGFGGADNPDLARAIADLSVTGENNFRSFVADSTLDDGTRSAAVLRERVIGKLNDAMVRLGVTTDLASDSAAVTEALDFVMDRVMNVAWTLNGPSSFQKDNRPALGWIAAASERDQPRRPVNVPVYDWPTADTDVTIDLHGISTTIRTRYGIGGASNASDEVSLLAVPSPWQPPVVDPDALVFVFLHGHSSRLEEAGGFYERLREAANNAYLLRPIVLITFDFPSNGYSQYFDHDSLAPFESTTHYVPDHPEQRRFGMLELYEKFVVGLVEAIDRDLVNSGQRGILDRIASVVGGSMGGNLSLRLSEHLVTRPWWLKTVVPWSPASIYESFGNKDSFIPSPGEELDPIGKEALDRPRMRCQELENGDSRANFIRLQVEGERLISDGTPGFEVGARVLGYLAGNLVFGLLGGVVGLIPGVGPALLPILNAGLVGPSIFTIALGEQAANFVALRQSDEWLRAECRAGYDQTIQTLGSLAELGERYSSIRRRTHWRVAYEQLLFSHQDVIRVSNGRRCYELASVPTLLIAGTDDTVDKMTGFDIFGGVEKVGPLMHAPGRVVCVANTGHSIHAERPKWLAREIIRFIQSQPFLANEVVAVDRTDSGAISRLYFTPTFRFTERQEAINHTLASQIGGGGNLYFFHTDAGQKVFIYARQYLSTTPDGIPGNNIRNLPETTLSALSGAEARTHMGPIAGFDVTHIRIRIAGPNPWQQWVSHLCNDTQEFQIPIQEAERRIQNRTARYTITHEGNEFELAVQQYLHTEPDGSPDNNLSTLPGLPEYVRNHFS